MLTMSGFVLEAFVTLVGVNIVIGNRSRALRVEEKEGLC